MDSILQSIFPSGAPSSGNSTARVDRIANEPIDQQIRNAGGDVLTAMLDAGINKTIELGANTDTGQALISNYRNQQAAQYAPWGVLIIIIILVMGFAGGRIFGK